MKTVSRRARTCVVTVVLGLVVLSCGARTGLVTPETGADIDAVSDVFLFRHDAQCTESGDGPACGNGCIDPGEECDEGGNNRLEPAFVLERMGAADVLAFPVQRRNSAPITYNYTSQSAHTGFESVGLANTFLYVNAVTNELSIFFVAGIDDMNGTIFQPDGLGQVTFQGVPTGAGVSVSDDPGELIGANGTFTGHWTFVQNTDGGVIGPLSWTLDWSIAVHATFDRGISAWRYVQREGTSVPLALGQTVVIRHRTRPSLCRPDCRVPRCGDGFLDGGERCDDGNDRTGDGCSADCAHIE